MTDKEHYYFVVLERIDYGSQDTRHETYAVDAMPFTWFKAFRGMEYEIAGAPGTPMHIAPSYMLLRFERISKDEYLDAVANGEACSMSDIRAALERLKDQNTGTGGPYR